MEKPANPGQPDWAQEFPGSITVCDLEGKIIWMNDLAAQTFASDGGFDLIGKNVLDCHPEPARTKLKNLLASGQSNVYTIETNGVKKLIYQCPWFDQSRYSGLVELSLEIPFVLAHFIRHKKPDAQKK